jgi:hypothetical protein
VTPGLGASISVNGTDSLGISSQSTFTYVGTSTYVGPNGETFSNNNYVVTATNGVAGFAVGQVVNMGSTTPAALAAQSGNVVNYAGAPPSAPAVYSSSNVGSIVAATAAATGTSDVSIISPNQAPTGPGIANGPLISGPTEWTINGVVYKSTLTGTVYVPDYTVPGSSGVNGTAIGSDTNASGSSGINGFAIGSDSSPTGYGN